MTFYEFWNILFGWWQMFLAFGEKAIEVMSTPIGDLVEQMFITADIGSTLVTAAVQWLLNTWLSNMSLIEFMFTGGIAVWVVYILVKFVLDIIF